MKRILVIPDTQVKPGVPLEHMTWLGKYICEIKPDYVVHIGDHFDMPSLSSYDKGTGYAEGRRVVEDIKVGKEALDMMWEPIQKMNRTALKNKKATYNPHKIFTIGNHEQRIERYVNSNPELIGQFGYGDVLEGLVLQLCRDAGHTVECEQEVVEYVDSATGIAFLDFDGFL